MPVHEDDADRPIPVVQETLRVGKRTVESDRVVLRKTVKHHDAVVETLLRSGAVRVERVKVGRVVGTAPAMREEGSVLIVPVLEETLVVEKRLVLKEELRIHRTETTRPARQTARLRQEEVTVEHLPSPSREQKD